MCVFFMQPFAIWYADQCVRVYNIIITLCNKEPEKTLEVNQNERDIKSEHIKYHFMKESDETNIVIEGTKLHWEEEI